MSNTPIVNAIQSYGANIDRIGEDTTIRVTPEGIYVDEYVEKPDGTLLANEGGPRDPFGDPVTVEKFYPHPTGRQVIYSHVEVVDEYTEKFTEYRADGKVVEKVYIDTRKRNRHRAGN